MTDDRTEAAELLKSVEDARKEVRSEIWPLSVSVLLLICANHLAAIVTGTARAGDYLILAAGAVIITRQVLRQRQFGASMHPATWLIAAAVFVADLVAYRALEGAARAAWALGSIVVGFAPMALANRAAVRRRRELAK